MPVQQRLHIPWSTPGPATEAGMNSASRSNVETTRSTDPPATAEVKLCEPVAERLADVAGRVVVVHAPAGYGKTVNIAAWARTDLRPTSWLELDAGDDDPSALLAVLVHALEAVTDLDSDSLPSVQGSPEQYATTVAPLFGRVVGRCRRPFVIVLDDVHVIENQSALDLIDALVRHVPAESTVVLIGRFEPRVPLARLRAEDGVVDITSLDLALDLPAATELLETMGVLLDDDDVERIRSATEGWAVGIRLAGLALLDDEEDPRTLGLSQLGDDDTAGDYVSEEWIRGLDDDEVDFLLQASWFDTLSAAFCDDVLDRTDSAALLHRLHLDRLLVIPLLKRGDQYRMHRLLRTVLLAESERMPVDRRRRAERRASVWLERTGDVDAAIRYAVHAGDTARAELLTVRHGTEHLTTGRHATVQRWLDLFPREHVLTSAPLCLMSAAATVALGNADTTQTWLRFARAADSAAGPEDDPFHTAHKISALWSVTATTVDADVLADVATAYEELAPGQWHALACLGYGQLSFGVGDRDRALALFEEGVAESRVAGGLTIEVQCRCSSALAWWETGDTARATGLARSARALMREQRFDDLPTLVLATAMSALVEATDGNPQAAIADIALTRRNLVYITAVASWANIQARLVLARASLLLGDRVGARTYADEAGAVLRHASGLVTPEAQLTDLVEQLNAGQSSLPYGPSSLTTAELRVLHYLPTNLTLTEIAQRLYVSRNTAKSHAAAVYRKLGVSSRGEAVELARSVGLLATGVAESNRH